MRRRWKRLRGTLTTALEWPEEEEAGHPFGFVSRTKLEQCSSSSNIHEEY